MTDAITLSRTEVETILLALEDSKTYDDGYAKWDRLEKSISIIRSTLAQQAESIPEALPPFGTKRKAAMAIYQAPFKYIRGYIYDANHEMVSDDDKVEGAVISRVRGWGRIGYMPNPEALQDEIGAMIADALTIYYKENK